MKEQEFTLNDTVRMRKAHPCGGDIFTVIRIGADVKIKCNTCGRVLMIGRAGFARKLKAVVSKKEGE